MSSAIGNRVAIREARERVARASRRLAQEGLVLDTAGNVSQRVDELVAITPTGARLGDLAAEQISVIDLDGALVDGDLVPTSEVALHLGIYQAYDAGAVVHTHAPMATALSTVLTELPVIHYHQLALGGPIAVAPYETFGTEALAQVTVSALAGRRGALMANHGAIVYAGDADRAADDSLLLEWLCQVYWHAAAIARPRALSRPECDAVVKAAVDRGYGEPRRRSG